MTNANHRLPFSPAQMSETLGIRAHCISPSLSEQLPLERSPDPFGEKKSFLINWNVCTRNCRECLTFALMGQQCVQWSDLFFFSIFLPACASQASKLREATQRHFFLRSDHPVHRSSQRLGLSKGKLCCILYLLQGTRL